MKPNPTIAAVTGSRRDDSHTAEAIEIALDHARAQGAVVDHVDVGEIDVPVLDPDRPDAGDAVELRRRIRRADAVLLGTPMYHGSFSSPLKTVLDYSGADEFEETTVGLLAVAGGGFPTPALNHLRSVCRTLDAWVLPHQVAVPNSHSQFADGGLQNEGLRERIETLGAALVTYAGVGAYSERTTGCAASVGD